MNHLIPEHTKNQCGLLYDFTLSTGLRQGEVLALPWFNVDLKQGTITVSRSVSFFSKCFWSRCNLFLLIFKEIGNNFKRLSSQVKKQKSLDQK